MCKWQSSAFVSEICGRWTLAEAESGEDADFGQFGCFDLNFHAARRHVTRHQVYNTNQLRFIEREKKNKTWKCIFILFNWNWTNESLLADELKD